MIILNIINFFIFPFPDCKTKLTLGQTTVWLESARVQRPVGNPQAGSYRGGEDKSGKE